MGLYGHLNIKTTNWRIIGYLFMLPVMGFCCTKEIFEPYPFDEFLGCCNEGCWRGDLTWTFVLREKCENK